MSHKKDPQTAGGKRLRALRECASRTQLDVELDANLGIGYLQRLELGKVQQPERETLERILAALGVSFAEQSEVLGLFGYAVETSTPTELEIQRAIDVFRCELDNASIPAYLLDCSHRLVTWNALVSQLFKLDRFVHPDGKPNYVSMPKLIFDPFYGITSAIVNRDEFFPAQIRVLQYEMQRFGDAVGHNQFIQEMRQFREFDRYWAERETAHAQIPMRPFAPVKLDLGDRLVQFRLIAETFLHDHRFRVIYYLPADSATLLQYQP